MTFCFDLQSRTLSNGKSLLLVGRTGTEIKDSGEDCGVWLMRVLGMPGTVVIKQSDSSEEDPEKNFTSQSHVLIA